MLIPSVGARALWRQQLDEPNASLHHASREQAGAAEVFRVLFIQAVQLGGRLRFAGKVDQIRDRRLHAERQLVIGNRGIHLVHGTITLRHAAVQPMQQVELAFLQRAVALARGDVGDGKTALPEQRSLVAGW